MRTSARIFIFALLTVFLVSCGRAPDTVPTEDTASHQTIYETPEIVFVRLDDNSKRIREGYYDGPVNVYYLFNRNGDVYRLDDPELSFEELTDKYSDGSLSDDMIRYMTIDDKDGLQTCFDKLQNVISNKDFRLTEPNDGPDWSHKDISWYGLYYDEEYKLQTKQIYFVGDLERRFYTNDQDADDIIKWLEGYVDLWRNLHLN